MKLAEHNLTVTHYRNGDPIRLAQSDEDWVDAGDKKEGAYCISPTGGHLYNWYAVNDQRGLAPSGFRIPTEDDFKSVNKSVNKVKSLRIYDGFRSCNGLFDNQGRYAFFWTLSEFSSGFAWYRCLYYVYSDLGWYYFNKRVGCSVRCIAEKSS